MAPCGAGSEQLQDLQLRLDATADYVHMPRVTAFWAPFRSGTRSAGVAVLARTSLLTS